MQIGQRFGNSAEELFGFNFRQFMVRFGQKIVVERVGSSILLNEIYFGSAFDCVDEFGYDRMIEFRKYVDFPF
jgi:hypothetical protein